MTAEQREAQAKTRFMIIGLVRLGGAALAIFGIVVLSGRFDSVPPVAGYLMLAAGLLDFALVPYALARAWRTPPEQ